MILKEAFRYQNYLDSILQNVEYYLQCDKNIMETIEDHQRSKSHSEAVDEKKSNVEDRRISAPVDKIIDFMCSVLDEKTALSKKINDAKLQHCSTMDMDMSMNKVRQGVVDTLKRMNANKDRKFTNRGAGSDYCFNSEGNQVTYRYDITYDVRASFNRKNVRKIISDMSSESNKVSNTIDYWRSSIPVDFSPKFDIEATMEELLEEFSAE